jgi:hypothetical protein
MGAPLSQYFFSSSSSSCLLPVSREVLFAVVFETSALLHGSSLFCHNHFPTFQIQSNASDPKKKKKK